METSMKTTRILALLATLAASVALAKVPKGGIPPDPCTDKAADGQAACSAKCFKVEPNKKDQTPNKQEMKCMEGCSKKAAVDKTKCSAEEAKKTEGKKEKDHARELDF
jgi:hypothetical protein